MKRALTAGAVAVAVTLSLSSQELMTPEQYLEIGRAHV